MLEGLSDRDLMHQWIVAAKMFCESQTPDLGAFAIITWETDCERKRRWLKKRTNEYLPFESTVGLLRSTESSFEYLQATSRDFIQVMQRQRSSKIDRELLKSDQFLERLGEQVYDHLCWSVDFKALTAPEIDPLEDRIWATIDRRKRQLQRRRGVTPAP